MAAKIKIFENSLILVTSAEFANTMIAVIRILRVTIFV